MSNEDTYSLPFRILVNKKFLTPAGVDSIEFTVGSIRKIFSEDSSDGITFMGDSFLIPLTLQEVEIFNAKSTSYQARIKFHTGQIKGSCVKMIYKKSIK